MRAPVTVIGLLAFSLAIMAWPPVSASHGPSGPAVGISFPSEGAYLRTGDPVNIAGTASAKETSYSFNPSPPQQEEQDSLTSVVVTADEIELAVDGLENWTASFTPTADGTHTVVATATSSSGLTKSVTRNFTTNAAGSPPPPPPTETEVLKDELKQLLAQNINLTLAIADLNAQITELGAQIEAHNTQISALGADLAKLRKDTDRLTMEASSGKAEDSQSQSNATRISGFDSGLAVFATLSTSLALAWRRVR